MHTSAQNVSFCVGELDSQTYFVRGQAQFSGTLAVFGAVSAIAVSVSVAVFFMLKPRGLKNGVASDLASCESEAGNKPQVKE
jgi:hypothetical protein